MTVKELKEFIKDMPDNREVLIAGWNGTNTVLRYMNPCCNNEHQEKVNQLWLSNEGLVYSKRAEKDGAK
jgi:hypothetical protein